MRKTLLRLIALSLLLAACMVIAAGCPAVAATGGTHAVNPNEAFGKVTKVTVTFFGDTEKAKGFTWYTTTASVGSDLQVLEKTSGTADFSNPKVMRFRGTCAKPANLPASTVSGKQEYLHKAAATGLKPGTTYFFRVGDASAGSGGLWSGAGTFTTAPAAGSFTFLDLADPQARELAEAKLAADTFKKAVATVPGASFIALNGDIVDDGSKEYEWDWLFGNMKSVMLNYTFAPIAGNHDSSSNSFIDHFDLRPAPGSPTSTGAYYSFDYLNAHFVMANTNENSPEYSDFTPAQIAWIQADVHKARARGAEWIILDLHKGPYTTSGHATDTDIMGATGVRTLAAPIFAKLGVDLVLQGHDHIYARSKQIKADGTANTEQIVTDSFHGRSVQYQINSNGTVYLIPATAGSQVYYRNKTINPGYFNLFDVADESHAAVYGPDPVKRTRPERGQIQNFESITIDGDKLTVVSYEIDRNRRPAAPYIIDTFGIEKGEITDKTPPIISIGAYNRNPTNHGVTVNARTNEGTLKAASHTFTANGTFSFIATDAAGNRTTKTVTITNIDKAGPAITICPHPTSPSNGNITVTASVAKCILNTDTYTFTRNGSFDFVALDAAGNVTRKTVTVSNIDKAKPVIAVMTSQGATVASNATVKGADLLATCSDANLLSKTVTLNGKSVSWPSTGTFTVRGIYIFTAKDKAGNISTFRVILK